MDKNLTSGLRNYLQIFPTDCRQWFAEEVSLGVSKRLAESYASLLGVGLGGGLFLTKSHLWLQSFPPPSPPLLLLRTTAPAN